MEAKETFRQRQINELEAIKSIYENEIEIMRDLNAGAKNLELKILFKGTHKSTSDEQPYVRTKLHIICPSKYPKVIPKINLVESRGLSDILIADLLQQLQMKATEVKGEVMMFELAQIVQDFIFAQDKPQPGSFYDEMLRQQATLKQERINKERLRVNEQREQFLHQVEKRQEVVRNEIKRSTSESKRSQYSSEEEISSPSNQDLVYPNRCCDHRTSETLEFPYFGRKILQGCCLGHSRKGCVAYSGIDNSSGQLLYITEWNIKKSRIEKKCQSNCFWFNDNVCVGHKVDDWISNLEKLVSKLQQQRHRNLVKYECVRCIERKDSCIVYLVQDFVLGTSISSITKSIGWSYDGVRWVAKGILDAVTHLNKDVMAHNQICDTSIFLDNTGTIRCKDFYLVPNLVTLVNEEKIPYPGDFAALGTLVEDIIPDMDADAESFVLACRNIRLTTLDLLEHNFITSTLHTSGAKKNSLTIPPTKLERQIVPFVNRPEIIATQSRLRTEFEILCSVGRGAFGDVLKVRNKLDSREYAIKRIPLKFKKKNLLEKLIREVEVLSRLHHENVVRYFNSWIEIATDEDLTEIKKGGESDWSITEQGSFLTTGNKVQSGCILLAEESSSDDFRQSDSSDTDSSGIEFRNSDEELPALPNDNSSIIEESERKISSPSSYNIQLMYIQMEFCEKSTLRTAIDDKTTLLSENPTRLWRLFREIVEGLSHLHEKGMIHRDLKPVNIFLDSRDQVKIGDFGLATTNFLAVQNKEQITGGTINAESGTGKVGTTLYVAPELNENASKSIYNKKVDMYTLGIILFEMTSPPFDTAMERVHTLEALRRQRVDIPKSMLENSMHKNTVQIIRWLLNHDATKRPTADELLSSDLLPAAPLEPNGLNETIRNALSRPTSKGYKRLIGKCLAQECDDVINSTYCYKLAYNPSIVKSCKDKIVKVFHKHGGIEMQAPLLLPYSKKNFLSENAVRLMTHSGTVVTLPTDLRAPFARHLADFAQFQKKMFRRYTFDRIFREEKGVNIHPRQYTECGFDIISVNDPGSLMVDAEIIMIAYELTHLFPLLKDKNLFIRINHSSLLEAILLHFNVPTERYDELFTHTMEFLEKKQDSRFQYNSAIGSIMENSKFSQQLTDILVSDYQLNSSSGGIRDCTAFRILLRGDNKISALAQRAINELESINKILTNLGIKCPIRLLPGLSHGFYRTKNGGIFWKMLCKLKRSSHSVIATGERYDHMLSYFTDLVKPGLRLKTNHEIAAVGFSFFVERLITALGSMDENKGIDVIACVSLAEPLHSDSIFLIKYLWSHGIRSAIIETVSQDEDELNKLAKELGAPHIISLSNVNEFHIRSYKESYREDHKGITTIDFPNYIRKILPLMESTVTSANSIKKDLNTERVDVRFFTDKKLLNTKRHIIETQVKKNMSSTLLLFDKSKKFRVFVCELPPNVINAMVAAINPREVVKSKFEYEIYEVIDRYPKYKSEINEVFDSIIRAISEEQIVALYNYTSNESYYRVIL